MLGDVWPMLLFFSVEWLGFNRNVNTMMHAVATSLIAVFHVPWMLEAEMGDASAWGSRSAKLTLQYMLYDLRHVTQPIYVMHHALAAAACLYVLCEATFANLVLFVGVTEISTIFLTAVYMNMCPQLMRRMFVVSFVVCRILWMGWVISTKKVNNVCLQTLLMAQTVMNGFWLCQIVRRSRIWIHFAWSRR